MLKRFNQGLGSVLLLALVTLSGCGGDDQAAEGGAGAGAGGTGGMQDNLPTSLGFEPSDTLKMIPGEQRVVSVAAEPAAPYLVRLALIGPFDDASLAPSEVWTDETGHAEFTLTAPTAPTTFTVRASVGDSAVVAEAGVSVSASGFATLQVKPSYAGKRSITYWSASARAGLKCADLPGSPPSDGDIKGSAPAGQVPQVADVPVGPTLAVTLRSAFNIGGCKDVRDLVAGEINEVTVPVSDVPLKVDETDLSVSMTLNPAAWNLALGDVIDTSKAAIAGAGNDDIIALLDAMQKSTGSEQDSDAFAQARASGAWNQVVTVALGGSALGPTAIRSIVYPWLLAGLGSLDGAKLEAHLLSAGKLPGHAFVDLSKVADVPADRAGFTSENLATWTADPGDTVLLGTSFFFIPSRLVTALAAGPALKAVPQATDVPQAISASLDCSSVATVLVKNGANASEAFPGCSQTCAEKLCESGVALLWKHARDASAGPKNPLGALVVSATGNAKVDEFARPTEFTGSWVGTFDVGKNTLSLSGKASASPPPNPR